MARRWVLIRTDLQRDGTSGMNVLLMEVLGVPSVQ
jgi:hypothetical protein